MNDVWLFSYGTLQQEDVQIATFKRRLEGRVDSLPGYALGELEINDPEVIATSGKKVHLIARPSTAWPPRERRRHGWVRWWHARGTVSFSGASSFCVCVATHI